MQPGRGPTRPDVPFDPPVPSDAARPHGTPPGYVAPFDQLYAACVSSWIRDDRELTWLAPGTPPPLSAARIAAWAKDRQFRYLLWDGVHGDPTAYAELAYMPDSDDEMWVGHFIVHPHRRSQSHGLRMLSTLLHAAFVQQGASVVLLVVFPENTPAIRCYQRAGFLPKGRERKRFPATGREHEFLRMALSRRQYEKLCRKASNALPPPLAIRAG